MRVVHRVGAFTRHLDPGDVAAIFVEPVQGEGGYVIPPNGFLRGFGSCAIAMVSCSCVTKYRAVSGRTGKMWACDHEGIEPDILLTAKGLGSGMPIGAMIARETIDRWQSGSHGSNFGGNPVCCAAALATLDLVEHELMANAATQGARLLTAMQRLASRYECIGDVRGRGLMIGVEFVKNHDTREPDSEIVHKLVESAFERGLLLLGAGKSALRLAPPLIIDATDIDTGVQIIEGCLAEITAA